MGSDYRAEGLTMPEILLAPRNDSEAVLLPGDKPRWRKKILKRGSIDYKGRKINFDDDYLKNIVSAYDDGAMDQVAFQLANDRNEHNWDPERYRGEAEKVFVDDDGDLSADFAFLPDAEKLVRQNPKLGVSVSLSENPDSTDGKKYPVVLGHVLGTLNPRVKGLGAWTPVNLSDYDADATYVDLTEATVAEPVAEQTVTPSREAFADLTDEQIEAMSPEDVEAWLAVLDDEPENTPAAPAAPAPAKGPVVPTQLSTPTDEQRTIELANAARTRADLDAVRAELATSKYEKLRDAYVRQGVPLAVVELARPLLEVPEDQVIELSADTTVNASDTVRKVLDSMAGFVKLNQEKGLLLSVTEDEKDPAVTAAEKAEADLLEKMKADPSWNF